MPSSIMTKRYASGLTQCGSTEQTIAISYALQDKENRDALRKWLDCLDEPIRYSNEDFDRRQGIAADLAGFARQHQFTQW
jgi:hypothetical protein